MSLTLYEIALFPLFSHAVLGVLPRLLWGSKCYYLFTVRPYRCESLLPSRGDVGVYDPPMKIWESTIFQGRCGSLQAMLEWKCWNSGIMLS